MDDELLTVPQVCDVLGIGTTTFYNWRKRNHGPPTVPIGPPDVLKKRLVRVRRSDLLSWLSGQQ